MPSRSRSRSAHRENGTEERRRRRRTGWDVCVPEGGEHSADPNAAAALAAAAAATLPTGGLSAMGLNTPGAAASGALMQNYQNKAMCRIYVGSLDYYLTEHELKSVFQAFGTIQSIDMPKEGDRSKGFCFVEYASPDAAQMALSTMQNFVLKGRTIKVGRPTAVGTASGMVGMVGMGGGMNMGGGMGMGGGMQTHVLPPMASPGPMSVISSAQAGAAAATAILAGRQSHHTPTEIAVVLNQAAMTPMKQAELLNAQGSNRVYVGNVPFGFSSDDLKKIFVCFGAILNCQLLPSQENPQQHRGYGFIEFAAPDAAKLAIETMNGFEVVGKQLKVNYATAMRTNALGQLMPIGMCGMDLPPPTPPSGSSGGTGANMTPLGASTFPLQMQEPVHTESPPSPPVHGPPETEASSPEVATEVAKGVPGSTPILLLTNMVAPDEVDDDLADEIREECSKYGAVTDVNVSVDPLVRIFIKFLDSQVAASAAPHLHGRWFGGKQILVEHFPEDLYVRMNFPTREHTNTEIPHPPQGFASEPSVEDVYADLNDNREANAIKSPSPIQSEAISCER